MGLGKSKLAAFASIVMFILNMVFLFILLPLYKIKGAAVAYFLSVLFVPVIVVIFEIKYLEKKDFISFYGKLFIKHLFTATAFGLVCRYLLLPLVTKIVALVFIGPLAVLLYLIIYKILGFMENEDWLVFKNFGHLILQRYFFKYDPKR